MSKIKEAETAPAKMSEITLRATKTLRHNPKNPRFIKDDRFKALVKSMTEFPEMLWKRPLIIVTDPGGKTFTVIGGNMRLKAAEEIGIKMVPTQLADDFTPEMQEAFLVKDNINHGDWDMGELNKWGKELLIDWGFEFPALNFTPNLTPGTAHKQVTGDDIQNMADKLDSQFQGSRPKVEVCCPHCTELFFIDKP